MAFANPFKQGTDSYKFFDALTEPAQAELLNNSYAMMTIGPVMAARGGYDAAIKDPQSFIFARPGGAPNPGSYEAYMAAHPTRTGGFGAFLKDAIGIALMAYPGVGTALGSSLGLTGTAAAVVGNAAINTALNGGDVLKGVVTAGIPILGKELAGNVASTLVESGMDKALADSASKIVTNVGMAAVQGKDPLTALINSGVTEATANITKDIPGFAGLSDAEQRSINAAITAELTGKDPTQAAINAAISAGNRKMAGTASPTDAASTGSTVGDFEDTEVTRLKGLGYTNDQIREYFGRLENLTEILDEPQETLPVEDTPATTRSLGGDPVKALEDAGLKYLPTDDDFMPTNDIEELVMTDKRQITPNPDYESVFDPTFGGSVPLTEEDIPELVMTDSRDKTQEHVFDPTFGGALPQPEADIPEFVMTAKRDKTQEHVFDPTFGGALPQPEADVPELVMTDTRDKTQEHVFDPTFGGSMPLPTTPGATPGTTPRTPTTPKTPAAPKTPTTPAASSGMDMMGLMALLGGQQQPVQQAPMQDPYAHIKLMEDLFGSNLDLTPTGNRTA